MTHDGIKIQPKWSLPYRVIRTSTDGQTAVVRSLVTHKPRKATLRDVHIDNVRFIRVPTNSHQRELWEQEILAGSNLKDVMDIDRQRELIAEFWERVEEPVGSKRRRVED